MKRILIVLAGIFFYYTVLYAQYKIVTGRVTTLEEIPLQKVQINVLKDAATSVYGNRGANGVVIVETKRGAKKR